MSGTSLDGVDLACCRFSQSDTGVFEWSILASETVGYPDEWRERLASIDKASACEYALADVQLGHYLGQLVAAFVKKNGLKADYVASHGHTVFHQPQLGLTAQIGDGDAIAAECGLPVVFNFRRLDVALGGQGAPLVPVGDRLLFGSHDACLNLGGIANISYENADGESSTSQRLAFDICPCNMALNRLAGWCGKPFDSDGEMAAEGRVVEPLLRQMEALEYYRLDAPKSLGKEWFEAQFEPLLSTGHFSVTDMLRTTVEHIAGRVADVVSANNIRSMLVSGGGARNRFLIERLREVSPGCNITVPRPEIIDYKEAVIFALLGYLRLEKIPNCLNSVTGARCSCTGGNVSGYW